jgi:hypothetical protein
VGGIRQRIPPTSHITHFSEWNYSVGHVYILSVRFGLLPGYAIWRTPHPRWSRCNPGRRTKVRSTERASPPYETSRDPPIFCSVASAVSVLTSASTYPKQAPGAVAAMLRSLWSSNDRRSVGAYVHLSARLLPYVPSLCSYLLTSPFDSVIGAYPFATHPFAVITSSAVAILPSFFTQNISHVHCRFPLPLYRLISCLRSLYIHLPVRPSPPPPSSPTSPPPRYHPSSSDTVAIVHSITYLLVYFFPYSFCCHTLFPLYFRFRLSSRLFCNSVCFQMPLLT